MPNEVLLKLEAAFGKLSIAPENRPRIPSVAATLAPLAGKDHLTRNPRFLKASRAASEKELVTSSVLLKLEQS